MAQSGPGRGTTKSPAPPMNWTVPYPPLETEVNDWIKSQGDHVTADAIDKWAAALPRVNAKELMSTNFQNAIVPWSPETASGELDSAPGLGFAPELSNPRRQSSNVVRDHDQPRQYAEAAAPAANFMTNFSEGQALEAALGTLAGTPLLPQMPKTLPEMPPDASLPQQPSYLETHGGSLPSPPAPPPATPRVMDVAQPPSFGPAEQEFLKTQAPNLMNESLRGAIQGATTGLLGGPVDLATMAMRPFGYSEEKPVGGSEWIRDRFQDLGIYGPRSGSGAESVGETVGSVLAPGPSAETHLAGALGGIIAGSGAIRNAAGKLPGQIGNWFKHPWEPGEIKAEISDEGFKLKPDWKDLHAEMANKLDTLKTEYANRPPGSPHIERPAQWLAERGYKNLSLPDFVEHPALFEAYPHLKDAKLKLINSPLSRGEYGMLRPAGGYGEDEVHINQNLPTGVTGQPGQDSASEVMLHELQHGAQFEDRTIPGANPHMYLPKDWSQMYRQTSDYLDDNMDDPEAQVLYSLLKQGGSEALGHYKGAGGEVEARMTADKYKHGTLSGDWSKPVTDFRDTPTELINDPRKPPQIDLTAARLLYESLRNKF